MKKSILGLLLSLAMIVMSGCGGSSGSNGDGSGTNMKEAGVQGSISNLAGNPIANASVAIGDTTVSTDAQGLYKIVMDAPQERVVVNVKHTDYMPNSRIVQVLTETFTTQDIKLDIAKASSTFDAGAGGDVTQSNGARVAFPIGAFVDKDGNPYSGAVVAKMSYYPITTFSGRDMFPGSFEGQEGEDTFPIKSYGFMNVEVTDPSLFLE